MSFIVRALRLGISANAASRGSNPYCVKSRQPMRFDYDRPAAWYVDDRGGDRPTVFATEKEAKEKTDVFIARIRAIIRVSHDSGRSVDLGHAATLLGHSFGTDTHLGGYDVAPLSEFQAERDEEERFHAAEAREKVAQADSEAQAAQARADALRGELVQAAPAAERGVGQWTATGTPKVQVYKRKDGAESFRARDDGKVSPSFPTLEEAAGWLAGGVPEKVSEERREAMEGLRDKMVRS